MNRPVKHMAINVVVLAAVLGGLSTLQPDAPLDPILGICEEDLPVPTDYAAKCDRTPPVGFNVLLEKASKEFGVDPKVLATTVYRESDCNPKAVGSSGEIGLGQIYPKVWMTTMKETGIANAASDLYDPLTNLRATAYVLNVLGERANNTHDLFRRYNGSGPKARRYADAQLAAYQTVWGK